MIPVSTVRASASVKQRPRLLSGNGPSYIAEELADYIKTNDMSHVRGAPFHPQTQASPLEKEHPDGHLTQWVYRLADIRGKGRGDIVAACSAMGDGNGLCFSFSNYADLVYCFYLRDSEIERLPATRKRIHELLSSWEKPTP